MGGGRLVILGGGIKINLKSATHTVTIKITTTHAWTLQIVCTFNGILTLSRLFGGTGKDFLCSL